MKINVFWLPLTIFLALSAQIADAQKIYTHGLATYTELKGSTSFESKTYFSGDSSASLTPLGPGNLKLITNAAGTYFALTIFMPDGSFKNAHILTPSEIKGLKEGMATYTFTATTDAKEINGFHCKRVIARDAKTNIDYDVWVTNDIKISASSILSPFTTLNAEVVQSPLIKGSQTILKSVTEEKSTCRGF